MDLTLEGGIQVPELESVQPAIFTEQQQRETSPHQAPAAGTPSYAEVIEAAIDANQIVPLLLRQARREDLEDDPGFALTPDVFKEHVRDAGVEERFWDAFTPGEIRSLGQLQQRVAELKEQGDRERILFSKGVAVGAGASVLASLLDPGAMALTYASRGALAPLIVSSKASRLARAIEGGILAASSVSTPPVLDPASAPAADAADAGVSALAAVHFDAALRTERRPCDGPLVEMHQGALANEAAQAGARVTARGRAEYGRFVAEEGTPLHGEAVNQDYLAQHPEWALWVAQDAPVPYMPFTAERQDLLGALLGGGGPAGLEKEPAVAWKAREHAGVRVAYARSASRCLNDFMLEQGSPWSEVENARHAFHREVVNALQGQRTASAAARQHAAEVRRLDDELSSRLARARRKSGLPAADTLSLEEYQPRCWSAAALDGLIDEQGGERVQEYLARALRGVPFEAAMALAGNLMHLTVRSRPGRLDVDALLRQGGDDLERYLCRELGVRIHDAPRLAESLRPYVGESEGGVDAWSRLDVDSEAVERFAETDIDALFASRAARVLGQLALVRHGIPDEHALRRRVREARAELSAAPVADKGELRARKLRLRRLEAATEQLADVGAEPLRTPGRYTVGLAQALEFGGQASGVALARLLVNVPELARAQQAASAGQLDERLAEEVSALLQPWDELPLLQRGGRRSGSMPGAAFIDQVIDAHVLKALSQTFLDAARTGKRHVLGAAQLGSLGIDEDLLKQVKAALMHKGGAQWDSKGRLRTLNLAGWDDKVRIRFSRALSRWRDLAVQGRAPVGTPDVLGGRPLGRLLSQFRAFMLATHARHQVGLLKQGDARAAEGFYNALFSGALAGLLPAARGPSGGMPALTVAELANDAFRQSAVAALLPGSIAPRLLLGISPLASLPRAELPLAPPGPGGFDPFFLPNVLGVRNALNLVHGE